jgi:hypothetical protein
LPKNQDDPFFCSFSDADEAKIPLVELEFTVDHIKTIQFGMNLPIDP